MRTLGVLLSVVLLAACSGSKTKHTALPTTSTTAPVPSSSATTGTTPPGPPNCTTAGLNVSLGGGAGAAGTIATPINFQNTSGIRCVLAGYPGVAALDANGKQAVQAARTPRGMIPGLPPGNDTPPVVTLNPGAMATAALEYGDVPTGDATSCPTYDAFLVTPPNETHSVQLKARSTVCARFEVHPIQAGSS